VTDGKRCSSPGNALSRTQKTVGKVRCTDVPDSENIAAGATTKTSLSPSVCVCVCVCRLCVCVCVCVCVLLEVCWMRRQIKYRDKRLGDITTELSTVTSTAMPTRKKHPLSPALFLCALISVLSFFRERGRERHTHRQTDRQTDRQRDRQTEQGLITPNGFPY